jgi:type III secretion protein V
MNQTASFLTRIVNRDVALPALAVAIVAMLVLPLPPWLLDSLIAVSIGSGLALLVYAIYIKSPVQLSTFPGLLLLTTMFRIALNVATARQILLTGDGGHIIETFGRLVVGGNIVVGLVVFAIVAIVQFIVVAKGAERVAEVAARFTLDALPGKQVSIDADLRSGILTQDQARAARTMLSAESQMFGAMDGAMKFVKGDVLAGMIIVLVNLVGGILVGIVYHGMTASEAANRYAILSIGDGLASQLPALMVALAAGILVTRAANENAPDLGGQIGMQLLASPRALLVTGTMTSLFMLVPGFPAFAFLMVGGALIYAGVYASRKSQSKGVSWSTQSLALARDGSKSPGHLLVEANSPAYAPLILELTDPLVAQMSPQRFEKSLSEMRDRLLRQTGLPFPGLLSRKSSGDTDPALQIYLHDVPIVRVVIPPQSVLVFAQEERLRAAGVNVKSPLAGYSGGYWVAQSDEKTLSSAGINFRDLESAVTFCLESVIQRHAADLLNLQDTKSILAQCERDWPDLTKEAASAVPLPRMNQILRNLLRESVAIRDMRTILQALVYAAQLPNDDIVLTEAVRQALARSIFFHLSSGSGRLRALHLGAMVEQQLRDAVRESIAGPVMSLAPELAENLVRQVSELQQVAMQASALPPVALLVAHDLRWHVRALLQTRLPALPVVVDADVPAQMKVQAVGVIESI